ncbi:MAG TPA: hypothetical protein VKA51_12855 [Rubrobacteraceae bacterium]|nr:hypothetical protein [Rubrobacteraceae bacterium]
MLRTILILVIVVIMLHLLIVFIGADPSQNGLTSGVVSLAELLETPTRVLINYLPLSAEQQQSVDSRAPYFVGFAAIGGYFVLFLLLGIGRR